MTTGEPLLLDEMFSPDLAVTLRADGYDVVAVLEVPRLRSAPDVEIAQWAAREGRRVVSENLGDFAALGGSGDPPLRVLLTSPVRFRRSRQNPGPLLKALRAWLDASPSGLPIDWLR